MATQDRNLGEMHLYSDLKNYGESILIPNNHSFSREPTETYEKIAQTWVESGAKRGFDLIVAAIGIAALLPVLGAVGIYVKLTSPGPILFRQQRVGKGQRPFTIYKFRTMHLLSEREGPSVTRSNDHRMTKAGLFLRRFKLDELPQLFNVIRGDMSLVGPRPKLESHERMQMTCKPGITGAATIVFSQEEALLREIPDELVETFTVNVLNEIKAKIDIDYAHKSTFQSDVNLIIATVAGSRHRKPITNLNELFQTYGSAYLPESSLPKLGA